MTGPLVLTSLQTIINCVNETPDKKLHINSIEYICLSKNENGDIVPFFYSKNGSMIELYSEDGWDTPEDIENWASITTRIINAVKSGNGSRFGYKNESKNFELK